MTKAATSTDTIRDIMPTGASGAALFNSMETWWSAAGDWQREMANFMALRLGKDGETVREALTLKNLNDMLAVQSHWMDETMRDYSAEMTKILTIYTKYEADAVQNRRPRS
jgi:hypothetical protein